MQKEETAEIIEDLHEKQVQQLLEMLLQIILVKFKNPFILYFSWL